ncbi:MAG: hypothetical protein HKN04_09210 [Rhodothermaceae bacterium]|nr:hypothetical protein [Rhodothermaceae bacterium]
MHVPRFLSTLGSLSFCVVVGAALLVYAGGAEPAAAPSPSPEEVAAQQAAVRQATLDSLLAPYAAVRLDHAPPSEAEVTRWADSVLATLSLDEKLGQLFIVDLNAGWLRGARSLEQVARDWHIGGFHVPRRMAPRTVLRHTNRLQPVARVPLFFTADYERGVGQASNNFTELPANMAFGAAASDLLAEAAGAVTAMEARATGVNILFAPVADVNNNPANPIINTRAYGADPALVGRLAGAFVRGAQAHGALATLKHFPGHGNTSIDTHVRFGQVPGTWADLDRIELAPYRVALPERPGLVMTAHLWTRALDAEETPATFSRRALTDILRDSLGYDGLITTDAIHMGALTSRYTFEERMLRPVQAGADLLLNTYDPRRGIAVLRTAVRDGRLTEERVDESVRRILEAKARLGLHRERLADPQRLERMLTEVRGTRVAQATADASITLLKAGPRLPLRSDQRVALVQLTNQPGAGSSAAMGRLERALNDALPLRTHRIGTSPGAGSRSTVLTSAQWADAVVLAMHLRVRQGEGVALNRAQMQLAEAVLDAGTPVVLVLFGNPYAALDLPEPDALVVAYSSARRSVTATAHLLLGQQEARGRLPVDLPGAYALGSGHGVTEMPAPPSVTD